MKSNFLKESLAAFAFTLAIVASFAFSTNESDTVSQYYIQTSPSVCTLIQQSIDCSIGGLNCTVDGTPNGVLAFESRNATQTTCILILSKD
ncbi:DUF6520 family protein [Mariniflexile sp. HMF6888]|uniref:DUF6520 family protein n=1 Tax=Mariniflexile sp. HMF6888 TaxID=3373086 RepID=UPI0037A51F17